MKFIIPMMVILTAAILFKASQDNKKDTIVTNRLMCEADSFIHQAEINKDSAVKYYNVDNCMCLYFKCLTYENTTKAHRILDSLRLYTE